jgi:hypothetical protein
MTYKLQKVKGLLATPPIYLFDWYLFVLQYLTDKSDSKGINYFH